MSRRLAVFFITLGILLAARSGVARAQSYRGCWYDDGSRALDAWLGDGHSVQSCINAARNAGHAYAGLQWYGQCFGGAAPGYFQTPESECNTPCTASPGELCGGSWRNAIYATAAAPGPTLTYCLKNGSWQSCGGQTCGVTECRDASWSWMACPADLTDSCQAATYCLKDGSWQGCSGQTCGVTECRDASWYWMACPVDLVDTCQTATYCLKNGSWQSCGGQTCGVTDCRDASWNWITCPADIVDACQTATYCLKDGAWQWCSGQTCGVTDCRDASWGWIACPADVVDACPLAYEGYLDVATCGTVSGWVWSPQLPNTPLRVEILDGATVLATIDANQYRADVQAAGKGNGVHGFAWNLPALTGTHTLGVRVAGTSYHLYGSPRSVTCAAAAEPLCGGGTASMAGLPTVTQMVCDVGVANNQLAVRFLGQWFALNFSGSDFGVVNNVAASSIYATPSDSTHTVYQDTELAQTRQEQLERAAANGTPATVHQRRTWSVSIGGRAYTVAAEQIVYDTRYGVPGDALEIAGDLSFRVTMVDPATGTWTALLNPRRAQASDPYGADGDQTAAESLEAIGAETVGTSGTVFGQRDVRYLPEVELASAIKTAGTSAAEYTTGTNPPLGGALEQILQPGQQYQAFYEPGAVALSGGVDDLVRPTTGDTVLADLHRASQFYLDTRNSAGFSNPGYEQPLLSLGPTSWKFRHTLLEHTQRWPFLLGLCGLEVHVRSFMDGALANSRGCFDGQYVFANVQGHLQIGLEAGGGFGCGIPFLASASAGLKGRAIGRVDLLSTAATNQLSVRVRVYSEVSYDAYFATRVLFWRKSWEKRLGTLALFNREYGYTAYAEIPGAWCPTVETSCRNGGDEDGDYLTDFADPDCYAPAFAAAGADALNANRQRLLERYAQRKGLSTCAAWSGWSIDQREVFATMTDRLQRSTHSQSGRSFLSHLDDLYGVVGRNGTACGGEDYNRAYFSMDSTLATTVRQIAALQPAATLSDPRTTVWKRSCDPNPHEPFSNGANGGSIDTHNGGTLTSPCTGATDAYPSGQVHFFPDPSAAIANQPLGRPSVESIVDPDALEMDHDYDLVHNSATQCYSRGGAPCGPLSLFGLCKQNIDNYRGAFNRDVMAFTPAGCSVP